MRFLPIVFMVFLLSSAASAADLEDVLTRVSEAQSEIQTLRARFVQEKQSAFFKDVQRSEGVLTYHSPDQVRWEYVTPSPMIVLISGQEVTFYDVEQKKAERTKIKRMNQKIQQYMMATKPLKKLKSYFTIYFAEEKSGPRYILKLVPMVRKIEKRIKYVLIEIDKKMNIPTVIEYVDSDGDRTRYSLSDFEINGELSKDEFTLDLPPDVEIQEFQFKSR